MKMPWLFLLAAFSAQAAEPALSLDEVLGAVKAENLTLRGERAGASGADSAAWGIGLPAPMVGVSRLKDSSGTARGFEISQTIPFPGKLAFEHAARKREAAMANASAEASEQEILAEAKLSYFRLWKEQARLGLLREKREAIEDHLRLARAATRSDNFLKIHVLKGEADSEALASELLAAEQELRERQIELAVLMNRDPAAFKPRAKEFAPSAVPVITSLAAPARLEARRWEVAALSAREVVEKSAWLPDFNLRYREMSGTMMNPRYSEIMVGASVPFLFFWEPKAAGGKAGAARERGELLLSQEERELSARRESLLARASSLRQRVRQYEEKLIPIAERRMKLVHNVAPRDMETLQDHRETMEAFPDLKLQALELRDQFEQTIAELEKLQAGAKNEE